MGVPFPVSGKQLTVRNLCQSLHDDRVFLQGGARVAPQSLQANPGIASRNAKSGSKGSENVFDTGPQPIGLGLIRH